MRALTEVERAQRRDELARHAAALFGETSYAGLTMDQVARRAGVSKGSVFLAFASKEDLVLHAVGLRLADWFGRLEGLDPGAGAQGFALTALQSLRSDPLLLPLLSLVGPILEQGCSPSAVVEFKQALATNVRNLATRWAHRVPQVPRDRWVPWFLQVYALTVGAWTVGEASSRVRSALATRDDLQFLLTRFEDLFIPMVEAQIKTLNL